ncbi:C2 domain containing protein [Histomonas meleagridis]|uniref:C2 domain containing protein n=1 Tax=Histomonas meleagridis TaxID=135588 RepID=UPI00355A56C2|nr:C2 domain containing protein [Histomonas meleagridis]KAH0800820.1 C2 domain containing protein [Histomonas meleagridis]
MPRSSLSKVDLQYQTRQVTVFSRWVANILKERNINFKDITTEFHDGVNLVNLVELLTGEKLKAKWSRQPTRDIQMLENCNLAVKHIEDEGVKLVNISGRDIFEGDIKLTLGFVWILIMKYNISKVAGTTSSDSDDDEEPPVVERSIDLDLEGEEAPKPQSQPKPKPANNVLQQLIAWCKKQVAGYPAAAPFEDYPISICALVHSFRPDCVDYDSLNPEETEKNAAIALQACEKAGVPVYLDPEDLYGNVDDKLLYTQLAALKQDLCYAPISGKPFMLTMTVDGKKLALRLTDELYLNSAGYKFELAQPNRDDIAQKFVFGDGDDITIVRALSREGWVFDVANADDLDPPEGTPFYVFYVHGRHNQRFTYKNKRVVAVQNDHAVTYVGGENPFVMMKQSSELKKQQEFRITYL